MIAGTEGQQKPWAGMLSRAMELHKSTGAQVTNEDEYFKVHVNTVGQVFVYRKRDGLLVYSKLTAERHEPDIIQSINATMATPYGARVQQPALGPQVAQAADPYADLKAALAAGKTIQLNRPTRGAWEDCYFKPSFSLPPNCYRVKPEAATPAPINLVDAIDRLAKSCASDDPLTRQVGGSHYRDCAIQPVEFIEANRLGFLEGCVVKRLARHDKPTGKGRQDIEKAIHELQILLAKRYPDATAN